VTTSDVSPTRQAFAGPTIRADKHRAAKMRANGRSLLC
jgi:hypothetical protein